MGKITQKFIQEISLTLVMTENINSLLTPILHCQKKNYPSRLNCLSWTNQSPLQ